PDPLNDDDPTGDAAIRPRPAFVEQFIGIVRAAPCSSASGADYPDARYYLDRAATKTTSGSLSTETENIPGLRQCLTAVNLAELADGTHLLPAGTLVQVFALFARAAGGRKVYVFHHPPPREVV